MELAAAEQGSTTSSRRRKRRRDEESLEEESWMQELRSTMKANQALLEKLLEKRSQGQSDREAFIRYVSDTLRTAPQEQYSVMKELITDIMREGGQSQRDSSRDTQGPSSSWARPGPSASAPQPSQPPHSPTSVRPTASSSSTTSPSPTTTSAATGSMVVVISSSRLPSSSSSSSSFPSSSSSRLPSSHYRLHAVPGNQLNLWEGFWPLPLVRTGT